MPSLQVAIAIIASLKRNILGNKEFASEKRQFDL